MTTSVMPYVEPSGIGRTKPLHASGKIGPFCFKKNMIVRCHQHIGAYVDFKTISQLTKRLKENRTALIIQEYAPPLIPPGKHMV